MENLNVIIAVIGKSGSGKTTSIRAMLDTLHVRGLISKQIPEKGDVEDDFNINGIKVGVLSQGDPGTQLRERLAKMAARGVNVIVCACRTRGETFQAVTSASDKFECRVIWTSPYEDGYSHDGIHKRLNSLKGEHLVALLMTELLFLSD